MKKRIFAFLLAFAMLVPTLVSCDMSPKDDGGKDTQGTQEKENILPVENLEYRLLTDGTYGVRLGEVGDSNKIVFPSSHEGVPVTRIVAGTRTSSDRTNIKEIIIPDTIVQIDNYAFEKCTALTEIVIPEGVESIGVCAFYDCRSLTKISIPDSIKHIGEDAFDKCPNLVYNEDDSAYYLGNANNPYAALASLKSTDITTFSIRSETKVIYGTPFYNCSSLENITIPEGIVTKIEDEAFRGCASLKSIVIPEGVKSIGDSAFAGCTSLTSVVLPDSLTGIGTFAFDGCASLTCVVIPDGIASIGTAAFINCSGLKSVVIPAGVMSIGDSAFRNCNQLKTVYYGGTASAWTIVSIGFYNEKFSAASRYYYSETKPSKTGKYWHYDGNGDPVAW
ncbi:MAG: leucine-rich repeat domain-containing protein [Clostridia bacterium]|nr:leucine-rich repeat domain-containing protein [Clostridia bacterium]